MPNTKNFPFCFLFALLILIYEQSFAADVAKIDADAATLRLAVIPPSPVAEQVSLDLRGALSNPSSEAQLWDVRFYLDRESTPTELYHETVSVPSGESRGIYFRWPAKGYAGHHRVLLVAQSGLKKLEVSRLIDIVPASADSAPQIGGAWAGIYHWSEEEGRLWNSELKLMDDGQWRELVRAMREVGMNVVVISEAFRNQAYVGKHDLEHQQYPGRSFYPSQLFPNRMDIAARDPFEAILYEADRLDMQVFLPVGMYAWFDFTAGSLAWHKEVASELWRLYGHHPSFYGWYVSEEIAGNLGDNDIRRQEIVEFFREFQQHVRRLAPEKPIMLASNAHGLREALDYYPKLFSHLDILCTFAFHRMPPGDLSGEEAASLLTRLADASGAHLWLDLELFLFDDNNALYPRPILGIASDLQRFANFEKVLGYQFPGLLSAPWMSRMPGGKATVELFEDYKRFQKGGAEAFRLQHAAREAAVSLEHPPTVPYTGVHGAASLTDGETSGTNYRTPAWIGYDGQDFVATVDLKQVVTVRSIQARFLQSITAGIFLPARVEFALGDSVESLKVVRTLENKLSMREPAPRVETFSVQDLHTDARYLRVRAVSPGPIPPWHSAAGARSWLFSDEILVNPGERVKPLGDRGSN